MGEQTTPQEPFEGAEAQGFYRQERLKRKVKGGIQVHPGQRKTQNAKQASDSSSESEHLQRVKQCPFKNAGLEGKM